MELFTKEIVTRLRANYGHDNCKPVVKIFNPYGGGTWLLCDMDDEGRCFGLCDLGQGFPELGSVMREELENARVLGALGLERDTSFKASQRVSNYYLDARRAGAVQA